MNALPPEDEENIGRFIEGLAFRNRSSVRVYRCILRGFLSFSRNQLSDHASPEKILCSWFKDRANHWPVHLVEHRAFMVQRFLSWMKGCAYIVDNPFDALEKRYGKETAPIVRALLSDDSKAALENLRPRARFSGFLGPQMREHLEFMRSLGYRYNTEQCLLDSFDQFLQTRAELLGQPLPVLIDAYRQVRPGVNHALAAQRCAWILSKAAHHRDPNVSIMPTDRQLRRTARARQRRPYIYTPQEVAKLLDVARSFPSPMCPLRPYSMFTMLVLAYCAGLRLGEIAKLTVGDINLEAATIKIRETKFFKTRRLSLTPSVTEAVRDYLEKRRNAGAPLDEAAGLFWHERNHRYSRVTIGQLLVGVLRRAGIKPSKGMVGPRVHDLRHAMACNRMLSWYQQGINPQSRLPHLATYLGHKSIDSTLFYLNITQELMQIAGNRFRERSARILKNQENRI